MIYALLLNDMRSPNIENIVVVRTADDPARLADWHDGQLAEAPWKDGPWDKAFRPGSELEWYNAHPDMSTIGSYRGGIWEVPDGTLAGTELRKSSIL